MMAQTKQYGVRQPVAGGVSRYVLRYRGSMFLSETNSE